MRSFLGRVKRRLTQSKSERRHGLVGPSSMWKMKRDFQIDFLTVSGLKPDHYLLDVGCGTLRGGIPMIEYLDEGRYFGIEARAEVLEEGRKELRDHDLEHKRPQLFATADIASLDVEQSFDFAWAFSVLIHMTDEILGDTLGFVAEHLERDGVFFANVNIGDDREAEWQGFPVMWRSHGFYRAACAEHGLSVADLGSLAKLGHVAEEEDQDAQRMLRISRSG